VGQVTPFIEMSEDTTLSGVPFLACCNHSVHLATTDEVLSSVEVLQGVHIPAHLQGRVRMSSQRAERASWTDDPGDRGRSPPMKNVGLLSPFCVCLMVHSLVTKGLLARSMSPAFG